MNLDIDDGFEIIKTAYIKRLEEQLWQQWLVERPHMEEFISFEDYKKKAFKNNNNENNSKIDTKKILDEAEKIKKIDQKGGKK